jgi:hypothetical protein
MKKLALCLSLVCIAIISYSQDETKTAKQFFTELGGPGVLFSANFDSRFSAKSPLGFGYRVGLGFTIKDAINIGGDDRTRSIATLPFGVNYLLGKGNSPHTFEIGAGATILFTKASLLNWSGNDKEGNLLGHVSFMYRRQPLNGGFTWRIGFTPIISTGGDIVPFGAIGIGYAFR